MRPNWLSLVPVLLILLVLAISYIVFTEPAGKPKISKAEAMQMAQTKYPDMSMENSSAVLSSYDIDGTNKAAWYVDVKTAPDLNTNPNCFIAYILVEGPNGTTKSIQSPMSWGGIVIIDATTGEILHVNPVA